MLHLILVMLRRTRILASLVKFIPFHDYSITTFFFVIISSSKGYLLVFVI